MSEDKLKQEENKTQEASDESSLSMDELSQLDLDNSFLDDDSNEENKEELTEEPKEEEASEEEVEEPEEEEAPEEAEEPKEKKFTFQKILAIILKGLKYFWAETFKFPMYIITHPLKGYEEFKREKRGKLWVALFFIALLIFLNILEYRYTGYIISQKDITQLHTGREIILVLGVVTILVVSNWSVTTLFDGKGKMIEILMMIGYCLFPTILAKIFGLIFSNFVTQNEAAVYTLLIGLGTFLTGYMGLFGLISIHEYGLVKCLLSIVGTILAALVICFVGILVFDLFQKMTVFIYTIYQEISLRYL